MKHRAPPRTATYRLRRTSAHGSGPLRFDPSEGNRVEVAGYYTWPEPIPVPGRMPRLTVRIEVDSPLGKVAQVTTYEWTAW